MIPFRHQASDSSLVCPLRAPVATEASAEKMRFGFWGVNGGDGEDTLSGAASLIRAAFTHNIHLGSLQRRLLSSAQLGNNRHSSGAEITGILFVFSLFF